MLNTCSFSYFLITTFGQRAHYAVIVRTFSYTRAMSHSTNNQVEAPWHAAYPAPKSEAVGISQSDLLVMLEEGKEPGKDFVLVDLRRNDHAVSSA